ncbi:MAG: hypothetical protein ACRD68_02915 [Pyrinomonadaceae bacterium]
MSQEGARDLSFFGRRNVVVYARAREVAYEEHTAPLSIKSTLKGREVYEVEGVPLAVDEGSHLVLNDDQPYASRIRSDEEVESFCVFFRDGLLREVSAPFRRSHEELLDDPGENPNSPPTFFQNLRRRDDWSPGGWRGCTPGSPVARRRSCGWTSSSTRSWKRCCKLTGILSGRSTRCRSRGARPG